MVQINTYSYTCGSDFWSNSEALKMDETNQHEGSSETQHVFTNRHFVHNTPNKQQAAHIKNTNTMIPPLPPASSDFTLIGECGPPTSQGGAQSLQHGNAIV